MNIFVLSKYLKTCAKYHLDAHCRKMIIEYAQILSTAHRILEPENCPDIMYKKISNPNHPCAVWVRESSENYIWLYKLFKYLCREYTFRYGRVHLTETKLMTILIRVPNGIPNVPMTPFRLAMPDECKIFNANGSPNAVASYRNYYMMEKGDLCVWTKRDEPRWFLEDNPKSDTEDSDSDTGS